MKPGRSPKPPKHRVHLWKSFIKTSSKAKHGLGPRVGLGMDTARIKVKK